MLRNIMIGLAASLMLALPTLAQNAATTSSARLAFVQNDALYALEPGAEAPVLVDDTPNQSYAAVWSPDGTKLAYLVNANDQQFSDMKTLRVWDGTQTIDVVSNINTTLGLPINWTRDGKLIYSLETDVMIGQDVMTEVYTVEPVAGAAPQLVSNQVPFGVGCGGMSLYPFDHAFWEESDMGGSRPIIQLTDFGLIYTSACAGGRTALFRTFSNEFVPFAEGKMLRSALSADQWSVAGVARENAGNVEFEEGTATIAVANLETGEEQTITTQHPVSQVAWGADGSLYYSSTRLDRNLLEGLTEHEIHAVSTVMGVPASSPVQTELFRHTVSLYKIAADGTETVLAENIDAYDIGRMQVVGNTLYFSTITNPETWLQAILDDTVTFENVMDISSDYTSTDIYSVDVSAPAAPTLVLENASQFAAAG
jgi:hypothetical protein